MGSEHPMIKKGGDKTITPMNFDQFNKKSIIKHVDEEQLQKTLKKYEQTQQMLTKYKYSEDFDRKQLSDRTVPYIQSRFQTICMTSVLMGYYLARTYTNYTYRSNSSSYIAIRLCIPWGCYVFFVGCLALAGNSANHIVNGPQNQQAQFDMRNYRCLDEQLSLYKHVDDIKYNYNYSDSDIWSLKKKFMRRWQDQLDNAIVKTIRQRYEDHQRFLK